MVLTGEGICFPVGYGPIRFVAKSLAKDRSLRQLLHCLFVFGENQSEHGHRTGRTFNLGHSLMHAHD